MTPESAGWTYVGFEVAPPRARRERARATTGEREACLVFVAGKARVERRRRELRRDRRAATSPFEGTPSRSTCRRARPGAPRRRPRSSSPSARRPGGGGHAARLIAPDDDRERTRGKGTNTRHVQQHPAGDRAGAQPAGRRGDHAGGPLVELSAAQARPRRAAGRVAPRGDLLPPPRPGAGLRLPARLHRRPLARRGDGGRGRRRRAGAARLPPGRRAARLRPLLPQRHGRPDAGSGASATTRRTSGW